MLILHAGTSLSWAIILGCEYPWRCFLTYLTGRVSCRASINASNSGGNSKSLKFCCGIVEENVIGGKRESCVDIVGFCGATMLRFPPSP